MPKVAELNQHKPWYMSLIFFSIFLVLKVNQKHCPKLKMGV